MQQNTNTGAKEGAPGTKGLNKVQRHVLKKLRANGLGKSECDGLEALMLGTITEDRADEFVENTIILNGYSLDCSVAVDELVSEGDSLDDLVKGICLFVLKQQNIDDEEHDGASLLNNGYYRRYLTNVATFLDKLSQIALNVKSTREMYELNQAK